MSWDRIRLCDKCGAGNPADSTECIRCGSQALGPPLEPYKEPPVPATVDLRSRTYPDEPCPRCSAAGPLPGILVPRRVPRDYWSIVIPGLKCGECGAVSPREGVKGDIASRVRPEHGESLEQMIAGALFVPRSVCVTDLLADHEDELGTYPRGATVPHVPTTAIACSESGVCFRLYFQSARDSAGLVATLLVRDDDSWLNVTPTVGRHELPSPWSAQLGLRLLPNGREIQTKLETLDVWTLSKCVSPGIRGGIVFILVADNGTRSHQITILNPAQHEDRRYVDLVNVFAEDDLAGSVLRQTWQYPEWQEKSRRMLAKAREMLEKESRPRWWQFWK